MLADSGKPGQNIAKKATEKVPEERLAGTSKTSAGQDEVSAILRSFLEEDIAE